MLKTLRACVRNHWTYPGKQILSATMRLYFPIVFSIILSQKSSAFLPKDVSDEVNNANPLPTETDLFSIEDLSLWGLGTEPDFAHNPTRPDETELDQDPLFSSGLIADSDFSSCQKSVKQVNKIRARVSEFCPKDQADLPPRGAELPNLDTPNILDDTMEKGSLELSIPELDLSINHPMCKNKKFVTHVCCDGPTGPWQAEGYFASVEKCWPCTSVRISKKMINCSAG